MPHTSKSETNEVQTAQAVDPAAICSACGQPATCIGAYEGDTEEKPACDDCCGHGNEDGHCRPISRTLKCPHCNSGLLWSEDRGAHCDGCDDFDPETDLPNAKAQTPPDSGTKDHE